MPKTRNQLGIKVRLETGEVGRVQEIVETSREAEATDRVVR